MRSPGLARSEAPDAPSTPFRNGGAPRDGAAAERGGGSPEALRGSGGGASFAPRARDGGAEDDAGRRVGGPVGGEPSRGGATRDGGAPAPRHGGAPALSEGPLPPPEVGLPRNGGGERNALAAGLLPVALAVGRGAPMAADSRGRLLGGSRPPRGTGDSGRFVPTLAPPSPPPPRGPRPPREAPLRARKQMYFSKAPVGESVLWSCLKVSIASRRFEGGSLANSNFVRTGSKFHLLMKPATSPEAPAALPPR
mmetsp:Transcript_104141/g.334014  ORF Transcript_104141/g.334014 Transcript_104141/m.334014 type:complete len:252 (-) Transcript_104141:494-1249(-)